MFNEYFPIGYMSKLPMYAGVYEKDKMENSYYLFEQGDNNWLILNLEFAPRNKVLEWANSIAKKYCDHMVIVNTHAYLYSDSTRMRPGHKWMPDTYGIGQLTGDEAANNGEEIWQKFVKQNENVRFVFSGHVTNSGTGTLVSINDAGKLVYQMLSDYQGFENGGNSLLRIVDFDIKDKTLNVRTYSPYIKECLDVPGHNFFIRNVSFNP